MTIDIIGAGIGGLTLANALQAKGVDYRIYERAEELRPVGAGIILANNAMQIYEKLGLKKKIEEKGNPISSFTITDRRLRCISGINLKYFEEKHGVQNIAIHRGVLQQLLLSNLKKSPKQGYELIDIQEQEKRYQLKFTNEKVVSSEMVIGADGIRSQVREVGLGGGVIRDHGQICWRGVADFELPENYQNELKEAWGGGDRIGFVKIADNKTYWYALKSINKTSTYTKDQIGHYYEDYNPVVKELILATSNNAIHEAHIEDLKPMSRWYRNNICLIGDAAHATTPNLGQGACQAIEDAYYLADSLSRSEPSVAFDEYQKIRKPKADTIVKLSSRIGQISHWENNLAVGLRNLFMKMTPEWVNRLQSKKIFSIDYL